VILFGEATQVAPVSDAVCSRRLAISDRFQILGYANGGYMAALAARVMAEELSHKDPLAVSTTFFRPSRAGAALVEIDLFDSKKSLSSAALTLSQNGQNKTFCVGSYTDFDRLAGDSIVDAGPVELVNYEACVPIAQLPYAPLPAPFTDQFNIRMGPRLLTEPRTGDRPIVEGWISFADGTAPDLYALILFADAFPPPLFNALEPAHWGSIPTVEYSVHVKARASAGPIYGHFAVTHMVREYLEIDGELRDCTGQLVLVSRQIAKFRKQPAGTPDR
jgi:hypothetical protein